MYINENEIEDGPDIEKLLLDSGMIRPFDDPVVTIVSEIRVMLMRYCKGIDDILEIRRNSDGFDLLGPVEIIVDKVFDTIRDQEDFSVIKTTINSAWKTIHAIIMTFPNYMRLSMYEICIELQKMEESISYITE